MKLIFNSLLLVFLVFSCKNNASQQAEIETARKQAEASKLRSTESTFAAPSLGKPYKITTGVVNWVGSMAVNGNQHFGTIQISSGSISVKDGKVLGGDATLDMTSLVSTDQTGQDKIELEKHLKNSDFFDVKKFPTAQFVITEIMPSNQQDFNLVLLGELTMKGIKKSVNIPAHVVIEGSKLTARTATFPVNRTDWGINTGSSLVEKIKDHIIADNVLINLKLEAMAE